MEPPNEYLSVGQAIRRVRERRGWSPRQLAAAVHVHRSTVVRWETQTMQLLEPRIRDVAAALGVSPVFLYQVRCDDGLQDVAPFPTAPRTPHQPPVQGTRRTP